MPKTVLTRRRSMVARLTVVAMIASLMALGAAPASAATIDTSASCPSGVPVAGFTDITTLDAATQGAINCVAYYGITKGTGATTFGPLGDVPRWQMALFLTRQATAHGLTLPSGADQGFTDLTGLDADTVKAINQIKQLNITKGTSATTFDPTGVVTREQMALFLARLVTAAGVVLPAAPADAFADDAALSAESQLAINQLAAAGVAAGTSATTFSPAANVLRWHMALFLTRVLAVDSITPTPKITVSPTDAAALSIGTSGSVTRSYTANVVLSSTVTIELINASDMSGNLFKTNTPGNPATAEISAVNGLAVSTDKTAVGSSTGTVSFTVKFTGQDTSGVVPVVYTGANLTIATGATATAPKASTNSAIGFGGLSTALNPAAAAAGPTTVTVLSVNKTLDYFVAGTNAYFYDANDTFALSGAPTDFATWESNLSTGDSVTFAPYASNSALVSSWNNTDLQPAAPAAPTFGTVKATSIVVNWVASANADSYNVQRQKDGTTTWTTVGSTTTAVTFTDTGLLPSTTYRYRIVAVSDGDTTNGAVSADQSTPAVTETVPPTMTVAVLTTDINTLAFLDTGDVIDFVFSEAMQAALGDTSATYFRLSDADSVYQIACGAIQATCVQDALEASSFSADTNGVADDHLQVTISGALLFVSGTNNGIDLTTTVTVTFVSPAWDDVAGNQLDLAGSADKTL